jgi:DNA-binding NarL/FixJ family response regulator
MVAGADLLSTTIKEIEARSTLTQVIHAFPTRSPSQGSSQPGDDSRKRILIIDDNYFFSFCLRTLIDCEPDLCVCDVAPSASGLLERVEHYRPHLLVMDLSAVTASGYHFARSLRTAGIVVPILFVSSCSSLSRRDLGRVPAASFMAKAGDPRRLIARIRRILDDAFKPEATLSSVVA